MYIMAGTMSSEYTPEIIQSLKQKVYVSARDGMAISIFAMLWNVDRDIVREVLNHHTEEKGQKTTPMIIAARNGEEKVVSVLLSNFHVDVEQTGTVTIDGFTIEGATSLWCAAGAGHFNVVKLLIENGADVNHGSSSNSTPLRAACFDNHIAIVKYLVEHNADITKANKYDNTCLMISSYKGHKESVRFLLEKGADPNAVAHCGATALHFAAECGHLEIVKDLVQYGSVQKVNNNNMTPLLVAAECGRAEVVVFFSSLPDCTKLDKITAFELLGASFANDKENYDISKAYLYLHAAMCERYSNPQCIIEKPYYPPIAAYENHIETKTVEELETIKLNLHTLHMESLAIRERILGPENPEVPHPVIFRGAVFADIARFDKCIALWMHAMILRFNNNRTISKDILRFSQVFSQMVHMGLTVEYDSVEEVIKYALMELGKDKKKMKEDKENLDTLIEIYQTNIHTCLYLFTLGLKCVKNEQHDESLHRVAYSFLDSSPSLNNGYTPLHMAVDSATLVDNFHVNDIVKFPSIGLSKLFVESGTNVNAQDKFGNTPLHIIVRYNNPISDFDTLHQILLLIIQSGAHIDMCNGERKTALETATTGVAEVILRSHSNLTLKCIAARAVRNYKLKYKGIVPLFLEDFIAIH